MERAGDVLVGCSMISVCLGDCVELFEFLSEPGRLRDHVIFFSLVWWMSGWRLVCPRGAGSLSGFSMAGAGRQ